MIGSVVFHMPGELQISPVISGWWERPILETLLEAEVLTYTNDVDSAVSEFIGWCSRQDSSEQSQAFRVISLPGLPWIDTQDWDRWSWYERVLDEFNNWEPQPILVDLENYLITQGGTVLWPEDGVIPTNKLLPFEDTPFSGGWYGQDLGSHRPGPDTYNYYPLAELPPIMQSLDGSYSWLTSANESESSIQGDVERTQAALTTLLETSPVGLPDSFAEFFRNDHLWRRIRSCTGCYLNLDDSAVAIPGDRGWLIRFLSDSQDCKHWHLHLLPGGESHFVSATYFFTGSEWAEQGGPCPHPRDTTVCAKSFEQFLYRFWLENAIWFALHDGAEMPDRAKEYLAHYDRVT